MNKDRKSVLKCIETGEICSLDYNVFMGFDKNAVISFGAVLNHVKSFRYDNDSDCYVTDSDVEFSKVKKSMEQLENIYNMSCEIKQYMSEDEFRNFQNDLFITECSSSKSSSNNADFYGVSACYSFVKNVFDTIRNGNEIKHLNDYAG